MSVYFVTCRQVSMVKIGHAALPHRRLSELRCHCPLPLELEAIIDGGIAEEMALHQRFADARERGEWFRITDEIERLITENPIPARPASASNVVADFLAEHRISQAALADLLGVEQPSISRWASGKLPVDRRTELALEALEGRA